LLYFILLVAFGERKQETNTSWTEIFASLLGTNSCSGLYHHKT